MKQVIFFVVAILVTLSSCGPKAYNYLSPTKTVNEIKETTNKLEKVFYMFVGHFSNQEQARQLNSSVYRSQEILSVPIWQARSGEYWAYLSWMLADNPELLITQEVYQFERYNTDSIKVTIYDLPDNKKKEYEKNREWKKREPLVDLTPKDLVLRNGCTAYITKKSENEFIMEGTPCERDISDDIKSFRPKGALSPKKIVLFNDMLAEDKETVVISYKDLGLQFQRSNKETPKYMEEEE